MNTSNAVKMPQFASTPQNVIAARVVSEIAILPMIDQVDHFQANTLIPIIINVIKPMNRAMPKNHQAEAGNPKRSIVGVA